MDSKGEWMPLQDCVDAKTPAQIAEDERGKVLHMLGGAATNMETVDRALAARAWATAEEMLKPPSRYADLSLFDEQAAEVVRLRREYEALGEKGEGQ